MNYGTRNTAAGATPGRGPERGSFIRDHLHECDPYIETYYKCLNENRMYGARCRREMKDYLDCRLAEGLMTEEDYSTMELPDPEEEVPELPDEVVQELGAKEKEGFTAGIGEVRWWEGSSGGKGS
eukprot:gb/GECH01000651.1/.p1 GENE.gb/GECH01000651.1/~~gb/GECH01000651.1/.p1  ORF type:complete len:125 (+),score=20.17 gb/GECH01000651.1/:1-375(+)